MPVRPPTPAVALALSAAIALAACTDDSPSIPETTVATTTTTTIPPRPSDGILTLGVYLPTTGPGAPLGTPMIDAVTDAVQHVNESGGVLGRDVEIVVLDENSEAGIESLLAENVDAIVGPASSRVALSELADTSDPVTGVVTCSPSATALALDDFPDNGWFFRTAPSDSLQMQAIAREVARTGVSTVSVAYLDDPYGRELRDALRPAIESERDVTLVAEVGFSSDESDMSGAARQLLEAEAGAVVILGDNDSGTRLLIALDDALRGAVAPRVVLNDSIRGTPAIMGGLARPFRQRITRVAPLATSVLTNESMPPFAAHAVDCVNLIALAALRSGDDAPAQFRRTIASVSDGGVICTSFEDCADRIEQNLQIDYNGLSGSVDLSASSSALLQAWFAAYDFDGNGTEAETRRFEIERSN